MTDENDNVRKLSARKRIKGFQNKSTDTDDLKIDTLPSIDVCILYAYVRRTCFICYLWFSNGVDVSLLLYDCFFFLLFIISISIFTFFCFDFPSPDNRGN